MTISPADSEDVPTYRAAKGLRFFMSLSYKVDKEKA